MLAEKSATPPAPSTPPPDYDPAKLHELRLHFEDVYQQLSKFTSPANERVDSDILVFQVPGGMTDDETVVLFAMFPQQIEALIKGTPAPEAKPARQTRGRIRHTVSSTAPVQRQRPQSPSNGSHYRRQRARSDRGENGRRTASGTLRNGSKASRARR